MLPHGNLLSFPENLNGEGRVPLAFFVLVENRCSETPVLSPNKNPAASGGEVEEGEFEKGDGVRDWPSRDY
jgi:hypothetical protein